MGEQSWASKLVPAPVRRFVKSTEAYHSTAAFLAGFGYDSATLRRIDQLFDNLILALYLLALGALLILERRVAHGWRPGGVLDRHRHLVQIGAQFLFGGLFSAYVIFYFKSAALGKSFFFLLLVAALMLVNEYYGRRLRQERVQLALYFFCVFSFLLYFIPVLTGWFGTWVFVLAGAGAFALLAGVTVLGYWALTEEDVPPIKASLARNGAVWGVIFATLFGFYRANLIPPVPLSLVHSGIYHEVEPDPAEGYELVYEQPRWYQFWRHDDDVFHFQEGDAAHCFTAVFAPVGMKIPVYHRWQYYDEKRGEWRQSDRIEFQVRGGRKGGFRGFTRKRNLREGSWRVIVETAEEKVLGTVGFELKKAPHPARGFETLVYE